MATRRRSRRVLDARVSCAPNAAAGGRVVLLLYLLFSRAITHVTNSDQRCKGHLLRAFVRGALWSSVYLLPLSTLVWAVHRVLPR